MGAERATRVKNNDNNKIKSIIYLQVVPYSGIQCEPNFRGSNLINAGHFISSLLHMGPVIKELLSIPY